MTQSATVTELARANSSYGFRRLYTAATRIGRAHIASVINTIVLAYAGASLPLMLLFAAVIESFLRQSHLSTAARLAFAAGTALFWVQFFTYGYLREKSARIAAGNLVEGADGTAVQPIQPARSPIVTADSAAGAR